MRSPPPVRRNGENEAQLKQNPSQLSREAERFFMYMGLRTHPLMAPRVIPLAKCFWKNG